MTSKAERRSGGDDEEPIGIDGVDVAYLCLGRSGRLAMDELKRERSQRLSRSKGANYTGRSARPGSMEPAVPKRICLLKGNPAVQTAQNLFSSALPNTGDSPNCRRTRVS